jgi:hypothetical protein
MKHEPSGEKSTNPTTLCPPIVLVRNRFLELQLRGVVATGNGVQKAILTHLCEYLMLHSCCKVIKSVVGAS